MMHAIITEKKEESNCFRLRWISQGPLQTDHPGTTTDRWLSAGLLKKKILRPGEEDREYGENIEEIFTNAPAPPSPIPPPPPPATPLPSPLPLLPLISPGNFGRVEPLVDFDSGFENNNTLIIEPSPIISPITSSPNRKRSAYQEFLVLSSPENISPRKQRERKRRRQAIFKQQSQIWPGLM